MLHAKFQVLYNSGSEEEFLKFFTRYIWAWRPSWKCDLDHIYKFSFPLSMDAPLERL